MEFLKIMFLACLILHGVWSNNSTATLRQVYKDLLIDYDTRLRPIVDQHETMIVNTYFTPTTVLELDIEMQRLTLFAHFGFYWSDAFLRWNLSDSDGVDNLWFPMSQVWHPTLILSTPYSGGRVYVGDSDDLVGVTHDGSVSWETRGVFQLVCEVDIEFYPFDTQECKINLYISDLPRHEVVLLPRADGIDWTKTIENPVWHILDMTAETDVVFGTQLLRYKFLFRRRAAFAMYTTIGPLIILAFLNSAAILVPIDSGEKGSIVMTLILSFCVYNSNISTYLPPNSIQNSSLLVFMTILEANSAAAVLYTMAQSYLYANDVRSPRLLGLFNVLKCFSRTKAVHPELDDSPVVKEHKSDADDKPTLTRNTYRGIDFFMFCVFLLTNITVIGVFVSKIQSSFRETLGGR